MQIVIDIDDDIYKEWKLEGKYCTHSYAQRLILNGTPLPEHLNKIKDDIGRYELDCRFADYSQTDECTICNKNVFGSIYKIIDKYTEESENE